ncbi:MAG: hypothetical protein A2667_00940 [Candidatus Wildermuthbacteria bacterium RIFCSPHIGHO2_01_FULL_47_27]|uniref:LamG-like jellyroll fold domain-containing protein n=1 Tax=Candidatus Wildermuthbacteria bacterium RIFCSPHIGHO2_02_FULL_47_17 TaxID=1802452 RepID=A0A1G2R7I3_9BACT|nr:MAG: hypothetical protein UY15_C0021G0004 [Parcubacteria group bacterium GW2011_GWA2_47_9]OHA64940.1 MAG: hypothetical protein A2667_00940 [Candidatus Wildermuthbacteria bacterium RIFCSPHIGHO2_01_FULL_47_27]OHA68835.1 MAG: hypothetical protein A3D59_01980 [Candidatus Wildermuthbacteria bacterium RIFCSPHIGHO2_02_FULL_47_17]OHA75557.1 MAG: hypothetical protein A3I38_03470 [Candidatus Wildermuthbacteria bacterium RIFCSPLOWO2_02_FULL_47_10]
MTRNEQAFTLIEMLVVIAVVGLLASVILFNASGSKEDARIVKLLEFSGTLHNVLGSELIGHWKLDEGSGDSAGDASGYGNNGIISGAQFTADTPHQMLAQGEGYWALAFFGGNDRITITDAPSLDINQRITVEAWVKLNSVPNNKAYTVVEKGNSCPTRNYGLYIDPDTARLNFSLVGCNNTFSQKRITLGVWHHIAVTYSDLTGIAVYYIDGKFDSKQTHGGSPKLGDGINNRALQLGGDKLDGVLDAVRIYHQTFTSGQIEKLYAEGVEKHKLAESR